MVNLFPNLYIILVEPVYKGNVGAICRTMNNFGFANLRIVGKVPDKEDYYLAVHSEDILKSAVIFDTLPEALADMNRTIAFSRRKGSHKKVDFWSQDVGAHISQFGDTTIGLVFGRETYGLTDEEASLCHFRCLIPTAPHFPSINLSQAVAMIMYEIFKVSGHDRVARRQVRKVNEAASAAKIAKTLRHVRVILDSCDFPRVGNVDLTLALLEKICVKSHLTPAELRNLAQTFNRFHVLLKGHGVRDEEFDRNET